MNLRPATLREYLSGSAPYVADDEPTCQECGELESDCRCVCDYCNRSAPCCICDERTELDE